MEEGKRKVHGVSWEVTGQETGDRSYRTEGRSSVLFSFDSQLPTLAPATPELL